ncbi:MAG: hypothetical protein HKM93_15680 [Desulfobacteraceae bacterium]|nr:hypothetical protein [Desulfobacteraceae bacterium]
MTRIKHVLFPRVLVLFVFAAFCISIAPSAWCAPSDYYGTYAGTFTGEDSGVWVAVISSSSSESLFLSYSTGHSTGDGGYLYFSTEYGTTGTYTSTSVMNDSDVSADVDSSDGSVSGTWANYYESGTFTGQAVTSVSQAGDYSGSFSGDESGTWSMTIASNGYVTGDMTVDGEAYPFEGGVHPDGRLIVVGVDGYGDDFVVYGLVSDSGISGSWSSESGDSGSVSSGSGSSGGGGGGGGCFLQQLMSP